MSILGHDVTLGICKESVEGEMPSSPVFNQFPVTAINLDEYVDTERRKYLADTVPDNVQIRNSYVEGYAAFQLTISELQPYLIELLRCSDTLHTNITSNTTNCAVLAASQAYEGVSGLYDFGSEGFKIGQFMEVSGFTQSVNNGIKRIHSAINTRTPTVHSEYPLVNESAGDSVSFVCQAYAPGGQDGSTFTLRRDQGGNKEYFTGCKIESITINFRLGEVVSGMINFRGLSRTVTVPGSETFVECSPQANLVSAATDLPVEYFGFEWDEGRTFTKLDLTISNNCFFGWNLGEVPPRTVFDGDVTVSLSGEAYLEDYTNFNRWKAGTLVGFGIVLNDGADKLCLSANELKLEQVERSNPGKNTFLFETYSAISVKDVQNKPIFINFY